MTDKYKSLRAELDSCKGSSDTWLPVDISEANELLSDLDKANTEIERLKNHIVLQDYGEICRHCGSWPCSCHNYGVITTGSDTLPPTDKDKH